MVTAAAAVAAAVHLNLHRCEHTKKLPNTWPFYTVSYFRLLAAVLHSISVVDAVSCRQYVRQAGFIDDARFTFVYNSF